MPKTRRPHTHKWKFYKFEFGPGSGTRTTYICVCGKKKTIAGVTGQAINAKN